MAFLLCRTAMRSRWCQSGVNRPSNLYTLPLLGSSSLPITRAMFPPFVLTTPGPESRSRRLLGER